MTFKEWLIKNDYLSNENNYENELSAEEADILYRKYLNEGYSE